MVHFIGRRRNEIIYCHVASFSFLFISCYLGFMLFKLPKRWIPSLVTSIAGIVFLKPDHIVDTIADNLLSFAKGRMYNMRIIKLIAFSTLSSFVFSSSSWLGFRFLLRLLLIETFNISLLYAISILIEYYLCSVSLS